MMKSTGKTLFKVRTLVKVPDTLLVSPLYVLQNFNLDFGSFPIFWNTLDDFDGDILLLCPVPALRYLAECALTNHLQDLVAGQQGIPQIDYIVPILVIPLRKLTISVTCDLL